jgi:hypothetical protein
LIAVKKIVRVFLFVLGSVWFFPVSCTVGMIAGEPISESLDVWTPDRREPPSSLFFVLAKETPDTATITGLPCKVWMRFWKPTMNEDGICLNHCNAWCWRFV